MVLSSLLDHLHADNPPHKMREIYDMRRPRTGGFLAARFLRRYRRGVFGFIGVRGKIVQRFV